MATIKKFEDIDAWKAGRVFCEKLGELIDKGVFKSNHRLIHQLEGSAGSIMDNIAEGFERGSRKEFIQFLDYAKGSCGECRSQLYRAADRHYISKNEFDELYLLLIRISIMIQKFIDYLQKTLIEGTRRKSDSYQKTTQTAQTT